MTIYKFINSALEVTSAYALIPFLHLFGSFTMQIEQNPLSPNCSATPLLLFVPRAQASRFIWYVSENFLFVFLVGIR